MSTDETLDLAWVDETLRVGMEALPSLFGDSGEDGVRTDEQGREYIRITRRTEDGQVFEVHRRLRDDELFEVLTEIPEPASPDQSIALRNQRTRRIHWATVSGLTRKYERIS